MNLIHRGRVARFATVPQNTTTLRSPFPSGEGFFAFPSGGWDIGHVSGNGCRNNKDNCRG